MSIKNLPKYVDMRGKLESKGTYSLVPLSSKTHIVIHHSLTITGSAEAYARYHTITNGWPGIAYHYVIEKDGTIKQCHNPNVKSYHAGNHNGYSIGVCLTGDFRIGKQKPTQEQMDSLYLLIKELRIEVPSVKTVCKHQDLKGYEWKNCPGDNWNYADVINGKGVSAKYIEVKPVVIKTPTPTPIKSLPFEYEIQEGDTLYSIANKHEGITVAELTALNPKIKITALKVGQVIRLVKESNTKYVVKKGDTLFGIARVFEGVTVNAIENANPSVKSNALVIGSELIIPKVEVKKVEVKVEEKKVVVKKPPPAKNKYAGKRAVSKVNSLNFYDKPSWEEKDIAGKVNKDLGFDVIEKVLVNKAYQYKVKNSKGQTYYITANEKYIKLV
jgi:LysM repeat protein